MENPDAISLTSLKGILDRPKRRPVRSSSKIPGDGSDVVMEEEEDGELGVGPDGPVVDVDVEEPEQNGNFLFICNYLG